MYHRRLLSSLCNKLLYMPVIRQHALAFDPSIQIGEDLRFLITYLKHVPGDSLVQINRSLYHYNRCGGTSLMSHFGRESMEEPLKDLDRLYQLLDYSEEERAQQLALDRKNIIKLRAYLIVHNVDMGWKEKRQLVLKMDPEQGKQLYRQNLILYVKERVLVLLRRIRCHF